MQKIKSYFCAKREKLYFNNNYFLAFYKINLGFKYCFCLMVKYINNTF